MKIDWRTCHDFMSTNDEAICRKCRYTIQGKGAQFNVDKKIECSTKYSVQMGEMIKEHYWYGTPPNSEFHVEYEPFRVVEVCMKDYL